METKKKKILGMDQDQFSMFLGKYGISVVLFFMVVIVAIMQPRFVAPSNLLNILTQISINGLIAFGMCLVITTGGIDLTVGAQLALVSCILGQLVGVRGMNTVLACVSHELIESFSRFMQD